MKKTKQESRKLRKLHSGGGKQDRLGGLPDAILCHILSFLPTKDSIATSVLAKRWSSLWTHTPNLDFDSDCLPQGTYLSDVINNVMSLYQTQSINTFRLYYEGEFRDSDLEKWIVALVARNVRNVDICLNCHETWIVPQCLFTCKTLVDLSLIWSAQIPISGVVYLPALKRLRLQEVNCESDESIVHFLSGCPVLQELIIDRIYNNMTCCYISSPTLIKLVLISETRCDSEYYDSHRLKIDTPMLKYLVVEDSMAEDVSIGPLNCLIEADIDFDNIPYSPSVIHFVGRLCNVKCMKLSSSRMPVHDSTFSALAIKFPNLTKLDFAGDCRFLSYILENADNLETLIVHKVCENRVPTCISSHLRTAIFHQFRGTEKELELIKLILWNAKVLKMMEIYPEYHKIGSDGAFGALKRIAKFQRGSVACELVFH